MLVAFETAPGLKLALFVIMMFLRTMALFITLIFVADKSDAALVCNRQKIEQSLQFAKSSPVITDYEKRPEIVPQFPVSAELKKLFLTLEMKSFGRHFLQIEDFPAWPGLTRHENVIQFSSITLKSLKENLHDPDLGAAFEIAHEMGHLIQDLKSPHNLKEISMSTNPQKFNLRHSETDCIAVHLLYKAGYPLTDDISKALTLIKAECTVEQPSSFCEQADNLRQTAVRNYIHTLQSKKSKN